MPLTPCHAAAAWPIRKALPALPLVPLLAGTMAPDFEYVLRLALKGDFAHSAPGLLLFCVPAGLAAWACFESAVRPGIGGLLPAGIAEALPPRPTWAKAAAAVLLGSASHVAWDSFTHPRGWAVERWAALGSEAVPGLPWFKVLQHSSTVAGGLLVLLWAGSRVRRLGPLVWPEGAVRCWTLVFALSAAGAAANATRAPAGLAAALGYAAVGAMAALATGLLLVSIAVHPRLRRA